MYLSIPVSYDSLELLSKGALEGLSFAADVHTYARTV